MLNKKEQASPLKKLDFKKDSKELYNPSVQPSLVTVPAMRFLMVDGRGNPNEAGGDYQRAVELLYAVSYTIKMSKQGAFQPAGYVDFTVAPLEGLWWLDDDTTLDFSQKEKYCWTSMIRQPDFVTQEVFEWARAARKKGPDTAGLRLQSYDEGLCVQAMHIGAYDSEPETIRKMEEFMAHNALASDLGSPSSDGMPRRHHELYLGDPRKLAPHKRRTILRLPVKRVR